MSIYATKGKDGKLNGRFRVEVQGCYQRYRARCNSIGEAKTTETEFKRLAAERLPPPPPSTNVGGRPKAAMGLHWPAGTPEAFLKALQSLQGGEQPAEPSVLLSKAVADAKGRLWISNERTQYNNEGHLDIIVATVPDVALNEIDDTWVLDLQETLKDTRQGKKKGEPISDATINRYLASLSTFLQYAIDKKWRTIRDLPKMEYAEEGAGRIRWFTDDEEAQLYALMPERSAKAVGVDIRTGLRRMELLTLEPEQISDEFVHIWEAKSGSPRSVPITPEDAKTLRWLVAGNMPTYTQLRDDWTNARKAMGLMDDPFFVFHACRHTFATRAVQKGVPLRVLQELLGHKTIEMTERYAHVYDEMKLDARDRMFGKAKVLIAA